VSDKVIVTYRSLGLMSENLRERRRMFIERGLIGFKSAAVQKSVLNSDRFKDLRLSGGLRFV